MRNVLILGSAQFFGAFGQVTMVILAGIVGAELTPDPRFATLPVACAVLGLAGTTVPAALSMQRFGRRPVFIGGMLVATAGTLVAAMAIETRAFWLFCAGTALMGSNNAFVAQFRFAAAESVPEALTSRAIAWVMLGTVGAAIVAPQLLIAVRGWSSTEYVASFVLLGAIYLLGAAALTGLKVPPPASHTTADAPARPFRQIARQSAFALAVMSAAIGYGTMALIMTATPVNMHVVDGLSVESTALVIQGHVLAMYLPSLVSGWLVARLGISRMIIAGTLAEMACVVVALSGREVMHYGAALIALGVGWNLMFVAGTTLLTRCYRPAERFRVQAVNDFCIFGVMAAASLLAGVLINVAGWLWLNLIALGPLLILLGTTLALKNTAALQRTWL